MPYLAGEHFIARLAALVPKPRVNLTRYHGVLAPNHRWCGLVTPAKRGKGLSVQFSFGNGGIQCEWNPQVPDQPLPRQMRRRYEEAQKLFVKHLADTLRGPIALASETGATLIAPGHDVKH